MNVSQLPIYAPLDTPLVGESEMLEVLTSTVLGVGLCALPLAFLEYVNVRIRKAENLAGRHAETDVDWKAHN
jgi:hypothetical protein